MHKLRFATMLCVAPALYAAPWSIPLLGAQPQPGQRGCLAIYETHATMTAEEAQEKGVPAGYRIVASADGVLKVLVREAAAIDGGDVAKAEQGVTQETASPIVGIAFKAEGTRKLAELTSKNVGRALAIVVDRRLISAPIVREPILEGKVNIAGNFTAGDAAKLASSIRSATCAG
jgi:SecD/SecF fusion protein